MNKWEIRDNNLKTGLYSPMGSKYSDRYFIADREQSYFHYFHDSDYPVYYTFNVSTAVLSGSLQVSFVKQIDIYNLR